MKKMEDIRKMSKEEAISELRDSKSKLKDGRFRLTPEGQKMDHKRMKKNIARVSTRLTEIRKYGK